MRWLKTILRPDPDTPPFRWWMQVLVTAAMLLSAYMLARPNQPFFYQGF